MYSINLHLIALSLLSLIALAFSSSPQYHVLPSLKDQASLINSWRSLRTANIPEILEKNKVDAWLLSQKEYAEDTAFWSLKSATQFSARRRTSSIYFSSSSKCPAQSHTWIDITENIWDDVRAVLEECDPERIAVNTDPQVAFASGLHKGEYDNLVKFLGPKWSDRFVKEPMVAVEYISKMPEQQLEWYRKLMETAWAMISEGFSEKVISPGKTTTEDIEWWFREKLQALNYTTWFHPDATIIVPGIDTGPRPPHGKVIQYGDLLHVDFGLTALGLNTDTQHLAYVLRPGETEAEIPHSYLEGLQKANHLQDIVRSQMKIGLTGNEILHNAREEMKKSNITGRIYSHPIGDWGHAAGTLIGMYDLQEGVEVLGDLPLLPDMYYSIELFAEHEVRPNQTLRFFLEEDVYWDEKSESWEWVYGRQEKFHLIRPVGEAPRLRVQAQEGLLFIERPLPKPLHL